MAVVNYMSDIEPFLIVNNLLGEYTMGEYIESSRMTLEGAYWCRNSFPGSHAKHQHLHVPCFPRGAAVGRVYT